MSHNNEHSGNYFKIHVHHESPFEHSKENEHKMPKNTLSKAHEKEDEVGEKTSKRTLRSVLTDATRQLVASAVILIIGIILLNLPAYTLILKQEWKQLMGATESPLEELVTNGEIKKTVLKTSPDMESSNKQIPELNLQVTPIDNRIIIPRIDQNIPIVRISSESLIRRDWTALEKDMQEALKGGVVHYPGTSLPGQQGNIAITGHSSYFPWDPGRFKDVFALLHYVVEGDNIIIYWDQKKYVYKVEKIEVVLPEDIKVLKQSPGDKLTLITCTPVGTNIKRLIVTATPVSEESISKEEGILR